MVLCLGEGEGLARQEFLEQTLSRPVGGVAVAKVPFYQEAISWQVL